jgi:hypothetical protein
MVRTIQTTRQLREFSLPGLARLGPARTYGTSLGRLCWRPLVCLAGTLFALPTCMGTIADADRAFLLMIVAVCLGACLVWAFWEIEQIRERWIQRRQREARRHISVPRPPA